MSNIADLRGFSDEESRAWVDELAVFVLLLLSGRPTGRSVDEVPELFRTFRTFEPFNTVAANTRKSPRDLKAQLGNVLDKWLPRELEDIGLKNEPSGRALISSVLTGRSELASENRPDTWDATGGPRPRAWTDRSRQTYLRQAADPLARYVVARNPGRRPMQPGASAPVRRRRLLIVEDQVGPELERRFRGDYECTLVEDLDQFWDITDTADMFDVALVDLHLDPGLRDQEGLVVMRWLAEHSKVRVVGMTAQLTENSSVSNMISKYNLIDLCTKSNSYESITKAVARAINGDADYVLLERLRTDLVRMVGVATSLADLKHGPEAVDEIERLAADVWRLTLRASLRDARAAVAELAERLGTG